MSFLTTAARMWLTRSAKPFCFTKEYDQNLPYTDTQQLGLYIHIPFCREICSFCPYCKVRYEKQLAQRYIDALTEEIHLVGKQQGNRKKTVTSLYIGGGSPALAVVLSATTSTLKERSSFTGAPIIFTGSSISWEVTSNFVTPKEYTTLSSVK